MSYPQFNLKATLDHFSAASKGKVMIYYKNTPLFLRRARNIYASKAIARRVLLNHCYGATEVEIDSLILDGTIEIKLLT